MHAVPRRIWFCFSHEILSVYCQFRLGVYTTYIHKYYCVLDCWSAEHHNATIISKPIGEYALMMPDESLTAIFIHIFFIFDSILMNKKIYKAGCRTLLSELYTYTLYSNLLSPGQFRIMHCFCIHKHNIVWSSNENHAVRVLLEIVQICQGIYNTHILPRRR